MSDGDWVLVGVDASGGSDAALRYGALEARRLGLDLRLLHVVPDYVSLASARQRALPLAPAEDRGAGVTLLARAADRLGGILPPSRISSAVVEGGRIARLTEAADRARLTVLGDRPRPAGGRLVSAGVLTGVAAYTNAPVTVVPGDWRERRAPETVVAALRLHETSTDLVRDALTIASQRKARLVLLHAWESPLLDPEGRLGETGSAWAAEILDQLEHVAAASAAQFPDVDLDVRLEHGPAGDVIVDASESADLVLLGRRPHGWPLGSLGSTGRSVVCRSRCPVEVLTATPSPVGREPASTARRQDSGSAR